MEPRPDGVDGSRTAAACSSRGALNGRRAEPQRGLERVGQDLLAGALLVGLAVAGVGDHATGDEHQVTAA